MTIRHSTAGHTGREEEPLLQSAVTDLPFDFFVRDADGRVILQSRESIRNWGDLRNTVLEEADQPQETIDDWRRNNLRVMQGETLELETAYQMPDGAHIFRTILTPIRQEGAIGGILGINLDITGEKKAEQALREREEQYASILEAISDTMCLVDREMRFVWVNRTMQELLPEPLVGRVCHQATQHSNIPCPGCIVWQTFQDGEPHEVLQEMTLRDGSKRAFLFNSSVAVRNEDGSPRQVLKKGRDVTEKRDAMLALEESQKRFELAVTAGNIGIWELWPERGELNSFYLLDLLGYDTDELGNNSSTWEALVHPDDLPVVTSQMKAVYEGTLENMEVENRFRCKDGSWKWLRTNGSLAYDEEKGVKWLLGTAIDITALKEAHQALAESGERLEMAVRSAEMGMWDYYPQNDALVINSYMPRTFYLHEGQNVVTIEFLRNHAHPDDIVLLEKQLTAHLEGKIANIACEFRYEVEENTWRRFEAEGRIVQRNELGEPVRLTGIVRDITRRHELKTAKMEAEKITERSLRLASLGTLAGGIAHEINQPLTVLKAEVDGLQIRQRLNQSITPAMITEVMEIASRQIGRIERIIHHMQHLIRDTRNNPVAVQLSDVVHRAVSLINQQLVHHGIETVFHLDAKLPSLKGDPVLLEQIVINLAVNAMHALDTTTVRPKRITFTTRRYQGFIVVEVADNGPGIPPDILSKIFDPFFSTKQNKNNMGLGLSIVENFMHSLGGSVTAHNQEEGGALFRLWFPGEKK